jgi:O-antigen chain-terminating methyltransferase
LRRENSLLPQNRSYFTRTPDHYAAGGSPKASSDPWSQEQLQDIADEAKHLLEALYVSFEDQSVVREDIKSRLSLSPLLKEAKVGSDQLPILDVGQGRMVELVKEEDLRAQGVDLNRVG